MVQPHIDLVGGSNIVISLSLSRLTVLQLALMPFVWGVGNWQQTLLSPAMHAAEV